MHFIQINVHDNIYILNGVVHVEDDTNTAIQHDTYKASQNDEAVN